MKDYKKSLNLKCCCSQVECPIRGNCVLCVQNHIENKNHIPECMQNMIRKDIKALAKMVEFKSMEERPKKEMWKAFDKEKFVKKTIERHKGVKGSRKT